MDPSSSDAGNRSLGTKKKKKKKKKKVENPVQTAQIEDDLQQQIDEERLRQEQEQLAEHQRKMEILAQKQKEYEEQLRIQEQ